MDEAVRVVIGLIDQFGKERLNEEYAVLCRKLAEKLARERPSPILSGSPNTWASGIIRGTGSEMGKLIMGTIGKALQIAAQAHDGQTDKDGQPYIFLTGMITEVQCLEAMGETS